MNTTTSITAPLDTPVEQLSLFESNVPERFRIDDATRRRGMRHIARIKAQLEARYPATPSPIPRTKSERGARDHAA